MKALELTKEDGAIIIKYNYKLNLLILFWNF